MHFARTLLAAGAAMVMASGAAGAATIKVGVILPYSGPEASNGFQLQRGIDLYMKEHPNVPGGNKIELIKRDSTGPAPDVAKRLATELVTRDHVQILTGVIYSPNAFAINDICKKAKVPFIIMNAGTASITQGCPYDARVSFTMWQASYPLGKYAHDKMGIKTAAVVYANYAPGKDSVNGFKKSFEAAGGKVVADIPLPFPNMPDMTPFMQRAKDAHPDAVYAFIPAGKWATALMKSFGEVGMAKAGVKLIGPGDITDDLELQNMGDVPLGVITMHHYSAAHKSKENEAFVAAWKKAYGPNSTPNFLGVQAWDGMAAIYHVIAATKGKITGPSAMKALEGWKHDSPRGPIEIDPKTRDIVDNQYLRKVEKVDGHLANVEMATIPMVKDPFKAMQKK